MKARTKGWLFIIGAGILSLIITLRDTLFNEQPLNTKNLVMMIIIYGVACVSYAMATKINTNK